MFVTFDIYLNVLSDIYDLLTGAPLAELHCHRYTSQLNNIKWWKFSDNLESLMFFGENNQILSLLVSEAAMIYPELIKILKSKGIVLPSDCHQSLNTCSIGDKAWKENVRILHEDQKKIKVPWFKTNMKKTEKSKGMRSKTSGFKSRRTSSIDKNQAVEECFSLPNEINVDDLSEISVTQSGITLLVNNMSQASCLCFVDKLSNETMIKR